MGIYLNPGNDMFQDMLNAQFYVDKTKLAVFMNGVLSTPNKYVCVSRPRRFGKSVDADMLVAYYSKGARSREQFKGLDVEADPSFEKHLNKHAVIKLDMTHFLPLIAQASEMGSVVTREVGRELADAWPSIPLDNCPTLASKLEAVWQATGEKFLFVIDEWDFVIREFQQDTAAQRAYLEFLRDVLKGRPYVVACYMTGILPIRKYGVHSALNMFTEYSMTDPDVLAPLTGFNADEVEGLCRRFGKDVEEVARWYDGYLLGPNQLHVYNPRSVAGAMCSTSLRSFWTDTESYEALQVYIDMDFEGIASDLLQMMDGAHIPANVERFSNTMTDFRDKDDVYTLLVHLGYLGYDQVDRSVFIPNEEIRREFVNALRGSARPGLARLAEGSRELIRATIEGDVDYVAAALNDAHSWAAGPRYYNDEQALRAAVKFAYVAAIDDYLRIDELPGGRGYADLVFIPKQASILPPMVVELKWDQPTDAALTQIHARNYPASLAGLSGECVLVGVTYHPQTGEHTCQIERIRLGDPCNR